tara:strand:+ start:8939 stop:10801 length:1863 start_codon:yes stop_codon:yes gene_type:complete
MSLRIRRGTNAERSGVTFFEGELVYTTDTKKLFVGDGATVGGIAVDSTAGSINSLTDVNIVGIQTGQILQWDGAQFIAGDDVGDKESVTGADSTILVDATNSSINLNGTVKGHIIPDQNEVYDLGSTTKRFNDLFLSGTTIDLGGTTITSSGGKLSFSQPIVATMETSGDIDVKDNNIINSGATGDVIIRPSNTGEFAVDNSVGARLFEVDLAGNSFGSVGSTVLQLPVYLSADYTAHASKVETGQLVFDNTTKSLKLYDGNAWVAVQGSGGGGSGIMEGQTYDINIVGDVIAGDSSIILDASASRYFGSVNATDGGPVITTGATNVLSSLDFGTGTILALKVTTLKNNTSDENIINMGSDKATSNISIGTVNADEINSGAIYGNFVGSLYSDASSQIIDGITGAINAAGGITTDDLNLPGSTLKVGVATTGPSIQLQATGTNDMSAQTSDRGKIVFQRNDTNGEVTEAVIAGGRSSVNMVINDGTNNFPETHTFIFNNSANFGLGKYVPSTKLHVAGSITADGGYIGGVQTISGPGAINLTTLHTEITTTGADAYTLADGTAGQLKIISMKVDGGDGTLTPTTLANGTTITFNDVNDSVTMIYSGLGWLPIAVQGAVVA